MGRSDYLVSAGIGFDLDRASAKRSVSLFEGIAGALNSVATKSAAKSFADTEKEYEKTVSKLNDINAKADADLLEGTEKSVKQAQAALDSSSKMVYPSKISKGALEKLGMNEKQYKAHYKRTQKAILKSYDEFQKNAEGLDIKFHENGKLRLEDFAKKDVETRKRAINLSKRMIKDKKKELETLSESGTKYKELQAEIKALEDQEKAMVNINEDRLELEKTNQKIHNDTAKEERIAEKKKITAQKRIQMGLKKTMQYTKEMGRLVADSAAKIKGGLQNAFVIGTAAASAFFYKMQPLAEEVMEFEKTLINANSVFNVTKKELFEVSDTMVKFTLKYGVSAQDTATGLYQLASAGLSAAESQEVLQSTMKLAMATQGDHNTLAKLTVQTIAGFGMEMSQTEELTDKFAHSIQKSLIEWQDLASSVKFAMPFFVATGQSIDELLGGLEVLTNRALEAGIAGRGLRQALAQFAKHADDNASALGRLGVEIIDQEGNMRDLHEIALDAKKAFGDVTDLEALTAMLEDMNVRGATAFALLVQNAEEFEGAVQDLGNSAGEATEMADIQQQSLSNQIQLVKNALLAPFLFADEVGAANNTLNEFTLRIQELVQEFVDFFIIVEDGEERLTAASEEIKIFVLDALEIAVDFIGRLKDLFLESEEGLTGFSSMLELAVAPMEVLLSILTKLEPSTMNLLIKFHMWNKILPVTNIAMMLLSNRMMAYSIATKLAAEANEDLTDSGMELEWQQIRSLVAKDAAIAGSWRMYFASKMEAMGLATVDYQAKSTTLTMKGLQMSMGIVIGLFTAAMFAGDKLSMVLIGLASVVGVLSIMNYMEWGSKGGPRKWAMAAAGIIAMFVTLVAARSALKSFLSPFGGGDMGGTESIFSGGQGSAKFDTAQSYDSGGVFMPKMYESGGPTTEHGMAVLQKGETVIPKTANMLSGGITLNIGGDIVTDDAEDFAERIAAVLPEALRKQNDIGGI